MAAVVPGGPSLEPEYTIGPIEVVEYIIRHLCQMADHLPSGPPFAAIEDFVNAICKLDTMALIRWAAEGGCEPVVRFVLENMALPSCTSKDETQHSLVRKAANT